MRHMLQSGFDLRVFVACFAVLTHAACAGDAPSISSAALVVDSAGVEIVVGSPGGHAVGWRLPPVALPHLLCSRGLHPDRRPRSSLPERFAGRRSPRQRRLGERATFLLRPTNGFRDPEPWYVEAHDVDGTLMREIARLDGVRRGTWEGAGVVMATLFDPAPSIAAAGATIAIATAREPEVQILDGDFRLRRIVRWSDPDREVTAAHIRAYRDALVERRGGREPMGSQP